MRLSAPPNLLAPLEAPTRKAIAWTLQAIAFLALASVWIWLDGRRGVLNRPLVWVSDLTAVALQVLSFARIAPLPWRWAERRSGAGSFLARLAVAFLACELWLTFLVLLDLVLRRSAGLPVSPLPALLLQWTLLGPLMTTVGGLTWAHQRAEEEKECIRQEAISAELRALQGQLHPHALYNALNGLAELIQEDPLRAGGMVRSLSRLLKQIQASIECITIPIADEFRILEDFLHLESLRYGSRLQVEWECDAGLEAVSVPPLVLQGLAENALRHGIWPHPAGGILRIIAQREAAHLRLEVRNTGKAPILKTTGGTGLANLRRRLSLLYGPRALFTLKREDDWTIAAILVEQTALEWKA